MSPDDAHPPPERPASWMGAPGYTPPPAYTPHPELPPHAPMPGAPPYPAGPQHPPAPVGQRPAGTSYGRVLAAAAVWAAVHVVLATVAAGPVSPGRFAAGLLISTVLAALAGWGWARRRGVPFWLLVLAVAPLFWVLRAVVAVPVG